MTQSTINEDRLGTTLRHRNQAREVTIPAKNSLLGALSIENPVRSAGSITLRGVPKNQLIQDVDFRILSSRIATISYEILLGIRPIQQLANWASPEVIMRLDHRLSIAADSQPGPGPSTRESVRIINTHVCEINPHVIESCVTLRVGQRVRACALRFEVFRHRWRATAIILG